jgi:cysteine-rich repeat protein
MKLLSLLFLFPYFALAQSTPSSQPQTVCGDTIQAEPEVCDDGNTQSGDGCRADCMGAELCGDGWVDLGELCDDGNLLSSDGCSARCTPDVVVPRLLQFATIPRNIESGERLDGLWRSTRIPVDWYSPSDDEKKDPKTARRLSRWSTVLGYAILSYGFVGPRLDQPSLKRGLLLNVSRLVGGSLAVLGPSAGHLYVGERRHAVRFSSYRLLLLAGSTALFAGAFQAKSSFFPAAISAGTLWVFTHREARDAKKAAERHNRALELNSTPHTTAGP